MRLLAGLRVCLLASLGFVTGCGPGAGNNAAGHNAQDISDALVPVEVRLSVEGGDCRAAIDGQHVDGEGLLRRGVVVLEASVRIQEQRRGRVDELPPAILRGGPGMPWRCFGGAIYQLQRAGFARVVFASTAHGGTVPFNLPLNLEGVIYEAGTEDRIVLNADGSLLFNGAPIAPERLSELLRVAASQSPIPFLVVRPEPQARMDGVIALLVRLRDAGFDPSPAHPDEGDFVGFESLWNPDDDDGIDRFAGELK